MSIQCHSFMNSMSISMHKKQIWRHLGFGLSVYLSVCLTVTKTINLTWHCYKATKNIFLLNHIRYNCIQGKFRPVLFLPFSELGLLNGQPIGMIYKMLCNKVGERMNSGLGESVSDLYRAKLCDFKTVFSTSYFIIINFMFIRLWSTFMNIIVKHHHIHC